ncbi:MAG: efflux RND transporter periplasmic adaptor subunit [Chloroflexi bacterium]|nr:efflux RND transporter periplasmic adaptor subunit [Chloroflexota bacterium]
MSSQSADAKATPTPIPTPIVPTKPTYETQRGEVTKSVQFSGRIAPVIEEELFFRTFGYVGAVFVERDDWVQAGDVLAELETTDLQNELAQAQAELETVQFSSARQLVEAQASLTIAELRLEQARARYPDLTAAEIVLRQATDAEVDAAYEYEKAEHRDWEWRYEDVRKAYTDMWQRAKDDLALTQASYEAAKAEQYIASLELTILETEMELAQMRLEEIEAGLDIQKIELVIKRLEDQLADARITAPFDGQIISLSLSRGRMAEGYKSVAIIADPGDLEVSADPSDKELEDLTEGMPVTMVLANQPDEEIQGHIRRLPYPYGGGGRSTDVEEEDQSTRITLGVTTAEAGYERGNLVRVTIVLERKDDVVWLPPQAIRTFEGRKFVVVQEGGAQLRVDVTVGIESEDRVEIEQGLTEGQIVIGQ